jgi:hypothetical protein
MLAKDNIGLDKACAKCEEREAMNDHVPNAHFSQQPRSSTLICFLRINLHAVSMSLRDFPTTLAHLRFNHNRRANVTCL